MAMASSAHAGFLLETAPAQTTPVRGQQSVSTAGGRNVDQSARLDRLAHMNRQRIDLDSRLASRMTQTGEPPMELPVMRGIGRDVTLEDALRQILPAGWNAYSDQDLPLDQIVSWTGNRTWPMVMNELMVSLDMRANVDWKNQEIMFFVPAPKEDLAKVVASAPAAKGVEVRTLPVPAAAAASAVASAPQVAAAAPTKPATEKVVVWTLSPEHTLRENLRRWASAANWNLVWNAVNGDSVIDYPVDAKVEFPGELLGATGAMAKVITAYRDADYPLEIEFFRGNRVAEVRLHRIPDTKSSANGSEVTAPSRQQMAPSDALAVVGSASLK